MLYQTLFQGSGPTHPFVDALWEVAYGLQNIAPFVTDKYNDLAAMYNLTSVYYARIVRAVQVMSHEYLQQGVATKDEDNVTGIPVPNFSVMLVELTRGTFHNSAHWIDIPMEYTEAVTTPTYGGHANSDQHDEYSVNGVHVPTKWTVDDFDLDHSHCTSGTHH